MTHENDGMRYPSIDQLVTKTKSKYRLVVGVAKRARQIDKDKCLLDENEIHSKKSIGMALEEVLADKIVMEDVE